MTLSLALLDLFLSFNANICFTTALPPLGNFDIIVSVSIDFPSTQNGMPHFMV